MYKICKTGGPRGDLPPPPPLPPRAEPLPSVSGAAIWTGVDGGTTKFSRSCVNTHGQQWSVYVYVYDNVLVRVVRPHDHTQARGLDSENSDGGRRAHESTWGGLGSRWAAPPPFRTPGPIDGVAAGMAAAPSDTEETAHRIPHIPMSPSFPGRALARMYVDIRGICASNDPILGGGGGGGQLPSWTGRASRGGGLFQSASKRGGEPSTPRGIRAAAGINLW